MAKIMKNGWWIVEGPDRVGKSTLLGNLVDYIPEQYKVMFTREPGSQKSDFCRKIRDIIMDEDIGDHDLFLMLADRVHHLQNVVFPAVREGQIVISDRGMLSTLVYQKEHFMHTADMILRFEQRLQAIEQMAKPNVLLLTSDVLTLLARGGKVNKFDADYDEDKVRLLIDNYRQAANFVKRQDIADVRILDIRDYPTEKKLTVACWRIMAAAMGIKIEETKEKIN